jgi:hypothetical protein
MTAGATTPCHRRTFSCRRLERPRHHCRTARPCLCSPQPRPSTAPSTSTTSLPGECRLTTSPPLSRRRADLEPTNHYVCTLQEPNAAHLPFSPSFPFAAAMAKSGVAMRASRPRRTSASQVPACSVEPPSLTTASLVSQAPARVQPLLPPNAAPPRAWNTRASRTLAAPGTHARAVAMPPLLRSRPGHHTHLRHAAAMPRHAHAPAPTSTRARRDPAALSSPCHGHAADLVSQEPACVCANPRRPHP